ncbi:hypothetical protein H7X87_01420 [Acetobacteraceae bacterium]|nr:hypothetical protein [Candidatus Parcubacteria bacterium]
MAQNDQEISWTVATHEHRERTTDWYWALGAIAFAAAGVSIFFGNVLLAAIIVIAVGSVGVLAARGPREHAVAIHKRGISIDGTLYPYASVHSFWIERDVEYPRLFLSTTGILAPHFTLPLPDHVPAQQVEKYLKQFVPEEEQGPHVGEHLAEMLGL